MTARSYATTLTVDETPEHVYAAINNVRQWWPDIEGSADRVGDRFKHRFEDIHRCELVVKELIPGKKVTWTVIDNHFSFTQDKSEWTGTEIVFEIAKRGRKTEIRFTHVGLVPDYECYDVCTNGWGGLLNDDLRNLINAGSGQH